MCLWICTDAAGDFAGGAAQLCGAHDGLAGLLPFAACFTLLVGVWRMHYIYSRRYGLEIIQHLPQYGPAVFVLFCVYPLKFIFTLCIRT